MFYNEAQVGKPLPQQFLNSSTPETLSCAILQSALDRGVAPPSLDGKVHNYSAPEYKFSRVDNYEKVLLDTSMCAYARKKGISMGQLLEQLDPSSNYPFDSKLGKMSATERQHYRFGYLNSSEHQHLPKADPTVEFATAHTTSNSILNPLFTLNQMFFDPLLDKELNPSILLAGTRTQSETAIKHVKIIDDFTPYRTLQILSELAMPRKFTMSMHSWASGMLEHGLAFEYSMEFARSISFSMYKQTLARGAQAESIALFAKILDTAINGDAAYGKPSSAPAVKASVLDPGASLGAGETSWVADLLMMDRLRPYKPDNRIMTINTYLNYTQAKVPSTVTLQEVREILQLTKLGAPSNVDGMEGFFDTSPHVVVVPSWTMVDDIILYQNVANGYTRVIRDKTERLDTGWDYKTGITTVVARLQEGLDANPFTDDAIQVLDLTL